MLRPTLPLPLAALCATLLHPAFLSAQATEITEGRTLRGSVAPGDTVVYAFESGEEYFVFGEVDQISVDVAVRILDPEGRQRARIDRTARGTDRFSGETEGAGDYTIQVIVSGDEDEQGEFTITLHRLEPVATDAAELVDQLMSPYDGDDSPGATVQVWRDGETLFSKAYGMANLAYGIPFETDTRTNIGSTSKQFTAFAVMLEAHRGALSLDDDIRKHLPELPEFDGTVTVRHLLTHTSGLREIFNLLMMTGRRIDRGDYVDRNEIFAVVQRQPTLQNAPGSEWNYNNTAFALASIIVERTSGQPFHEYMADNVFGPLGMTRTMVRPHAEAIVPDHSQGYTPDDDGFRQSRDLGAAVGAGGIYSTVEDLQTWVENYSDPRVGTRAMIDEMMTPYVLTNGDTTEYGYGLSVGEQRGLRRVNHGGADIAHRSMLAYYPEIDAGITTQSNHAGFPSSVAFRLAEAFFEDAMEPEEEAVAAHGTFDPEAYDAEDFDEFAGRYALDAATNFVLTFVREGETLYSQATGQPRVEIVPTSDSTFALAVAEASVVFHRGEDGTVEGLTLNQNGQEQHATRLGDGEEAEEWAPSVDDLRDFEGRYYSDEIESFFAVTLETPDGEPARVDEGAARADAESATANGDREDEDARARLVLKHRRLDDATLSPGEEDTFSGAAFAGGNLILSFERDRNGLIIGFYMSNGRTRDVRFERVR